MALFIRDDLRLTIDRNLALDRPRRAGDVNAFDEVPCSTWFCARNHATPLTLAQVATGPAGTSPPELPLAISSGKVGGVSSGFSAVDARGRKYLVKFDPARHPRLASGADVIGNRVFYAAGYNTPGAFAIELGRNDLRLAPGATRLLSGVAERPLTEQHIEQMLDSAARGPGGKATAVAVPWIPGQPLGGFDFKGRRSDDPNDRIAHEDRRSLRASFVLFAWLNNFDASAINTLDSYVEEDGRRFVRHYFIDFGSALGSSTTEIKSVHEGRERMFDANRITTALLTLGLYQRQWQEDTGKWRVAEYAQPTVGWFHPLDEWSPEDFRTGRRIPAHQRQTWADKYWGAKLVTSFSDAQIQAIVDQAGYDAASARLVRDGLIARRDLIGKQYLLAVAAVERPSVSADGRAVCFDDLAIVRGYAAAARTEYTVRVAAPDQRVLAESQHRAAGARTCLPLPYGPGDYKVMSVESSVNGRKARSARVHLAWRPRDGRFAVVGLERDDQ